MYWISVQRSFVDGSDHHKGICFQQCLHAVCHPELRAPIWITNHTRTISLLFSQFLLNLKMSKADGRCLQWNSGFRAKKEAGINWKRQDRIFFSSSFPHFGRWEVTKENDGCCMFSLCYCYENLTVIPYIYRDGHWGVCVVKQRRKKTAILTADDQKDELLRSNVYKWKINNK